MSKGPQATPSSGVISAHVSKHGADERVVVHLGGVRAFDVSAEVVAGAGLRVGTEMTAESVARLQSEDEPYRARARALRLLSLRDRCCQDLRARLRHAGFSENSTESAVEWLRRLGYVDDARFAEHYAAEKARSGWGARRIAAELARLGVDRRDIQAAAAGAGLGGEDREEDERAGIEAALALSRRRFGGQFASDPDGASRRLTAFLARRGFAWDEIRTIVRTLAREGEDSETESGDKQPFS